MPYRTFFVTEEIGSLNLLREGKPADQVHFVGHVMIDNLFHQVKKLEDENVETYSVFNLKPAKKTYAFMTLHRPSNVDDRKTFMMIAAALDEIAEEMTIIFSVHPRTKKMMEQFQIRLSENIKLLSPLGFKESLFLWKDAKVVLTDSGGLQEETTALGVPCVTIRENTERPVTIEMGTNVLGGTTKESILHAYRESLGKAGKASVPPYWDGKASERIWDVLTSHLG